MIKDEDKLCYNVNGLQAFVVEEDPDIICLQEIKTDTPPDIYLKNYLVFLHPSLTKNHHRRI